MKLKEYVTLTATLRLKSGLHIGTGEEVGHGEPLPVLCSPRTGLPYVPGSTLKGKMRCLLEQFYGQKKTNPKDQGSPCWCGACNICLLFGGGDAKSASEPSRLIFRDCYLNDVSEKRLEEIDLEEKPGVQIDRNTGKAHSGALFPMNRVPEGLEYKIEISARVFEKDDKDALRDWLAMGLYLIEQDALGGGGTRGSGHVEITDILFNGVNFEDNWKDACKQNKDNLPNKNLKIAQ